MHTLRSSSDAPHWGLQYMWDLNSCHRPSTGIMLLINLIWWSPCMPDLQFNVQIVRYLNNKGIISWADLWDG